MMKRRFYPLFLILFSTTFAVFFVYQVVALAAVASNSGPNPQPTPQAGAAQLEASQPKPILPKVDFVQASVKDTVADVTPSYIAELEAGESATFTYTYTVPEVVFNRGDIMFVFDRTGSMGEELSTAKAASIQIMNSIREDLPYAWFGVASFMDYPGYFVYPGYADTYGDAAAGDLPWILEIDPAEDITEVASSINALTLGSGWDWPEDYTRALYELRFSKWRADTKKIAVLFGDAPTHDLNFAGYNFGGDPGPNAIAQDADDLDFETVVSQLATDGVSVIAVDSGYSPESAATFKGMSIGFAEANGTGGLYYNLSDTSELPDKVVELIKSETGIIDKLLIEYTPEYSSWVTTTPPDFENLVPNTTVEFDIQVTVPEETEPGFYPFVGTVEGDGQILKLIYFEITVPGGSGDMDLGYRPGHDGYSFVNFDSDSSWYTELSWDMFQQYYSANQVLHPNGDRIGMAQYFYDHTYKTPGAFCDGFASTSMFNFLGMTPGNAGKYALPHYDKLWDVDLKAAVRDSLAFAQRIQLSAEFLAQELATCEVLDDSPKAYFRYLKSLFENDQPAVVGVVWYDDTKKKDVGHALLPYRLEEDPDHHMNYIYVYDSNDPKEWWDTEHRIEIDTDNDTWSYDIQTLWFAGIQTITGDKDDGCKLQVRPLDLYTHKGVPPWEIVSAQGQMEASLITPEYRSFTVYGPTQLLIIDDVGRRLGRYDDVYYEEIPGGMFIPDSSGIEELGGTYMIPDDIQYNLALIGAGSGKGGMDYWHNNNLLSLRDINLVDGMMVGVVISVDETSIKLQSITGALHVDLIASHLMSGKDVAVHVSNLAIEDGSASSLTFAPVSELVSTLGDIVTLTTNNSAPQNVGVGLIHRGGEGYSAFSNSEALVEAGSTATVAVTDWQNLPEITIYTDLDGDGYPDTTQILKNTSQASLIELQADRLQVYAGEAIQLIATVKDQLEVPVNNGTPVEFYTTLGKLSALDGTTSGGLVVVNLDSDGTWGTATITASVPGSEVTASIEVVYMPRMFHLPVITR